MAIWIDSLSPAKNSMNVSVSSEINITLMSDAADLNLETLRFCINDVEINPSSRYSIQSGTTEDRQTVFVDFFPRRRIKYANERYGADDTRYGKLDIYPSNFLYGLRYVGKIYIEDMSGNVFEDFFSFTIEEGIFYNNNPDSNFYSTNTQAMANYLPPWTKARYDQFSNFQQIINPAGNFLQAIDDKINSDFANYYVQTANYNELSLMHKAEIGKDFNFNTIILDDGTSLQVPPDVMARLNISLLYPNAEFGNNIREVYYDKLPSRLQEDKIRLTDNVLYPKTLASTLRFDVNRRLERQGTVCFNIEDGTSFSGQSNTGQDLLIFAVRIYGTSVDDENQEEEITIIDNDNYFSKKRWARISHIRFFNIPADSGINFTLQYFPEANSFIADTYRHTNKEDETQTSFWKLTESVHGSVLGQYNFVETGLEDIISTKGQKTAVLEYELVDIDNSTNLNLLSIAADPFSNWIYGIDEGYLYIFDKREPYTKVIEFLPKNNINPNFVVDISAGGETRDGAGKEIEVSAMQTTIGKTVTRYRFKVRFPNGTVWYINPADGTLSSNKSENIIVTSQRNLQLITEGFTLTLPDLGDYIISVEASYLDGSKSEDAKIVRVMKKAALAKYKLERLLFEAQAVNLFRDFDGRIKVHDSQGFLHSLIFSRDNMLIDYENGILYFNEQYDEVEVDG